MAWQEWFPDFKVPRDVQKLVDAGLLRDTTLDWSASPNFTAVLSDGRPLVLHVEHPMAGKRTGQEKRYELRLWEPSGRNKTLLETDSLEATMEALRAILRSEEGGPRLAGPSMGSSEGGYWIPAWYPTEV